MDNYPKSNDKQKKPIEKKLSMILILIIVIAAVFVIYFNFLSATNAKEFTQTFSMISPNEAFDLINNSTDGLTIVDIRPCECNYEKGHLPGSIWNINPTSFYNTTDDLIIYDQEGEISIGFCEKLVNNVYGKIMFLQGGYQKWIEKGYPVLI